MNQLKIKRNAVLLITGLVVCLLLGGFALLVVQKHRAAAQRIADAEPRYARMLGLQQQRPELDAALAHSKALRAQYVYPATEDAAQTGNAAQQRTRDIFSSAGLQIVSSQVLPAKAEKGVERIPLSVRVEGDLLSLQSALAVLFSQSPVIFLDDLDVQSQNSANQKSPVAARLAVQFSLSVLREPS